MLLRRRTAQKVYSIRSLRSRLKMFKSFKTLKSFKTFLISEPMTQPIVLANDRPLVLPRRTSGKDSGEGLNGWNVWNGERSDYTGTERSDIN